MFGLLVTLLIIGVIVFLFGRAFRKRAARNLEQAGFEIPREIAELTASKRVPANTAAAAAVAAMSARASAAGAPAAKPIAAGVLTGGLSSGLVVAQAGTTPRPAMAVPPGVPSPAPLPPAPHFLLIYDVWPDFVQQRGKYRAEHLALAWKSAGAGELVLAGALEEPVEQAFLLFRGSREAATRFAQADPYVRHGLVKQWRVKQWHTVVGEMAAAPLRPGGAPSAIKP